MQERLCRTVASFACFMLLAAAPAWGAEWCAPVRLDSVSSIGNDNGPEVSSDERTLYFASNRNGGMGLGDLYASRRASRHDEWGAPVNLGPPINTSALEQGATLWHGGHVLFFSSDRVDPSAPSGAPDGHGCGPLAATVVGASCDIWVSERQDAKDDQGWNEPVRLGPPVNTREYSEGMGDIREDESTGAIELYFSSTRPRDGSDAPGDQDIYVARTDADGRFGEPELIAEVSSDAQDQRVTVSRDGLVMMFQSTRGGGLGSSDLWMSTRESTDDAWTAPVNLADLDTSAFEGGPRLSENGKTLYFFSSGHRTTPGTDVDLFVSRHARDDGTCDE